MIRRAATLICVSILACSSDGADGDSEVAVADTSDGGAATTPEADVGGGEEIAVEDTAVEVTTAEDTAVEDTAVDDTAIEDTAVDDTVIEDTAIEDTAIEDTAIEDTAIEDTAIEDAAIEDTAVQDTAIEDTAVEDSPEAFGFEITALEPRSYAGAAPEAGLLVLTVVGVAPDSSPEARVAGVPAEISDELADLATDARCDPADRRCFALTPPVSDRLGERDVEVSWEGVTRATWLTHHHDIEELASDRPHVADAPLDHVVRTFALPGLDVPFRVRVIANDNEATPDVTEAFIHLFEVVAETEIPRGSVAVDLVGGIDQIALEPRPEFDQGDAPRFGLSYRTALPSGLGDDASDLTVGGALVEVARAEDGYVLETPRYFGIARQGWEMLVAYLVPPDPGLVSDSDQPPDWRGVAVASDGTGLAIIDAPVRGAISDLTEAPTREETIALEGLSDGPFASCALAPDHDTRQRSMLVCVDMAGKVEEADIDHGGLDGVHVLVHEMMHQALTATGADRIAQYATAAGYIPAGEIAADVPESLLVALTGLTDTGHVVVDLFERLAEGGFADALRLVSRPPEPEGRASADYADLLITLPDLDAMKISEMQSRGTGHALGPPPPALLIDCVDCAVEGVLPAAPLPNAGVVPERREGDALTITTNIGTTDVRAPSTRAPFADGSGSSGARALLDMRHLRVAAGFWSVAKVSGALERRSLEVARAEGLPLIAMKPPESHVIMSTIEATTHLSYGPLEGDVLDLYAGPEDTLEVGSVRIEPPADSELSTLTFSVDRYAVETSMEVPSPHVASFQAATCLAKVRGFYAPGVGVIRWTETSLMEVVITSRDGRAWAGIGPGDGSEISLEALYAGEPVDEPRRNLVVTSFRADQVPVAAVSYILVGQVGVRGETKTELTTLSRTTEDGAARFATNRVTVASPFIELLTPGDFRRLGLEALGLERDEDGTPVGIWLLNPADQDPAWERFFASDTDGGEITALDLFAAGDIASIQDLDGDGGDDLLFVVTSNALDQQGKANVSPGAWVLRSRADGWAAPYRLESGLATGVVVGGQDATSLSMRRVVGATDRDWQGAILGYFDGLAILK